MPAHNERFGATAARSADLKGSAEMPPLRQAAGPLGVIWRQCSGIRLSKKENSRNGSDFDNGKVTATAEVLHFFCALRKVVFFARCAK